MSVYKRGNVWWACYAGPSGKVIRESTGATDKRVAERIERQRKTQVRDGTWSPRSRTTRQSVADYAETYIARRHAKGHSTASDDETRLRLHVLPVVGHFALEDLKPRHVVALVDALSDSHLAPRSVHHCFNALRQLMKAAQFDELAPGNPCDALPSGTLPKKRDRDPSWRHTAVFSRHEIETLITDERVPLDRRTYYALLCLAGLRHGEAAGRRWREYDPTATPLGRLLVPTQYDGEETKTQSPRAVPVHPTLAAVLAEWKLDGFGFFFGRSPRPSDWIVPSRRGRVRSVRHTLRRLNEDLARLGFRGRRTHDLRRTFTSLAREGGADKDILRTITHRGATDVMDLYTSVRWSVLCETVLCIGVDRRRGEVHNMVHTANSKIPEVPVFQIDRGRSGRDSKP